MAARREDENKHIDVARETSNATARPTVTRSQGETPSERYLKELCDKSFRSLWSYPNIFRDQGRSGGKGDGKEIADLLVVFENHVIIFSDKQIRFDGGDIQGAWARWFKTAVLKSAHQVLGAERWIRQFPNRLFLDKNCSRPFPIVLPAPEKTVFHRIVVAHDVSRVCRDRMGGSGRLMLNAQVRGSEHLTSPLVVGHIEPASG